MKMLKYILSHRYSSAGFAADILHFMQLIGWPLENPIAKTPLSPPVYSEQYKLISVDCNFFFSILYTRLENLNDDAFVLALQYVTKK